MFGIPNFTDRENDFNAWMRRATPIATVVLLTLVIVMQQFLLGITSTTMTEPPESIRTSEEVDEPGISGLALHSKMAVKAKAGGFPFEEPWPDVLREIEQVAATRTDRLRVAVVAGELLGKDAAEARLNALKSELAPGSELASDADALLMLYKKGRDAMPPEAVRSLVDRHGWFGELAAGVEAPPGDPYRVKSVMGITRILAAERAQGVVHAVMFIAAIGFFIAMIKRFNNRELESHFESTTFPPGIYLEMFTAFLQLFLVLLCLQVMTLWLTGTASVVALVGNEMILWLIPLCFAWPWIRGVKWVLVSEDLGWTAGEGIWKEVAWGVAAFLAAMPIDWLVGLAIHLVKLNMGWEEDDGMSGFATFETPLSGSWVPVILGTMSAVLWAPVVEETVFRGAFYRYLRTRMGVALAVVISAACFGAIHPYGGTGILQVGVSGVIFALMREWRGALIAPVVAHALHNGSLSLFEIWTISAVNG